jgi:hypothetical protein
MFALLDTDGSNRVSRSEFLQLVSILKIQWEEEEVVTYLEHHWPHLYHMATFQRIRTVVLSNGFQYGACCVPPATCALSHAVEWMETPCVWFKSLRLG